MEKKKITNYVNNSTTESIDFVVEGYTGNDIIKDFKLQKTFHISNMHLFHPNKGIYKYESPEEILLDFVEIRTKTYKKEENTSYTCFKRKKSKKMENMSKFVDMVIHEKLIVFKRKRSDLEHEIRKIFDKIDNSYDYLLNIKTYQYTHEAVQSLREETEKIKKELELLQNMSHIDMWKSDLKIYK